MARMSSPRGYLPVVAAVAAPLIVTAVLVPFRSSVANTDAALLLVAVNVAVAAFTGNRAAGYLCALVSATAYDFFLTKPYETLNITRSADIQTTVLLVVIGAAVTEIAVWGRRQHATAIRRAEYLSGVYTTAEAAATSGGPSAVIPHVTKELSALLDLSSCRFQYGVAGLGEPAQLHHDGSVTLRGQDWPVDTEGLPSSQSVELLVTHRGLLQGRFLMVARPGAHPTLENRRVAAALADLCSTALLETVASN
jgi:K+-sensing histidine kinase KdpD